MPLISVLSSLYAPSATFIEETIKSVSNLAVPDGWELEWVIQEDGDGPQFRERFETIPFARYSANGRQMGLPYTRNLALTRANGELTQLLDHDDVLLPHALTTMIPRLKDEPSIYWGVGQADDLMPDGSQVAFPPALPFGRVPAGVANDWAIEHKGNWPLHCAALIINTDLLRAVGGWVGIPIDDDIAMFAQLAEVADGWHEETLTWLYRQHPRQLHNAGDWLARSAEGRQVALQRLTALRRMPLRLHTELTSERRHVGIAEAGPLHVDKLRHESAEGAAPGLNHP